ncbi:MAG TPA: photosynthetic reaction center cytochrome c subunit family protein [Vicinamibacterales bacterium]|nr:photosynthetic reaction center cytochrome c subunit family protein [Vicinamibacterales bacterium]
MIRARAIVAVVLCASLPAGEAFSPDRQAAVRLFSGLSQAEVQAVMEGYNEALGVGCDHCHVTDRWLDDSKPAFVTARNMTRMVTALNAGALREIGEIACWTCHSGQRQPSRQPRAALDAELARWPSTLADAPESQKLGMAVYNVALGVTCDHCHTQDWTEASKPPMKLVATMNGMFTEFPKYMPATARTQCWMCHKGSTRPKLRRR